MGIFTVLFDLIMGPIELLFDTVFAFMLRFTDNEGIAIVALSLAINLLILPLYKRADAMQEEERLRAQKLASGVNHIKKVFKGDMRFMVLNTYYRQNNYKPYYALKGSLSLLLEIPFFIAAYDYLSNLDRLSATAFGPIADLSKPDGLLHIAGHALNLLPLLMTAINIVSGIIYTKGMPLKSKLQLYGMAIIFLVFLYGSPSGLVFYWTLNNLFSLIKNIFYRVRHTKLVLSIISAVTAIVSLPYVVFIGPFDSIRKQTIAIIALVLMLLPLSLHFIFKKRKAPITISEATKTDNIIFYACCIFLTLLIGVLIPSAVIHSSPDEFVEINTLRSPLRYIFHSFILAAGTFTVWMNVFYHLSTSSVKKIMSAGSIIVAVSSIVNYMFYGDYGTMSSLLEYYDSFLNTPMQNALNLAVLAVIGAVVYLIWRKRPAIVKSVCMAGCVTVLAMSCVNMFQIQSSFISLQKSISVNLSDGNSANHKAKLTLDKTGRNVVVIMMDRAINSYFPFLVEEKPELKEQFAGFTYYPNTISYGNFTNVGTPGLYGGYEYIPEENNKRSDEWLRDKQNEALKIMPVLFSANGYDVTVCDPTYAGYQWMPDLRIYDEYPEISKYITNGYFFSDDDLKKITTDTDQLLNRNFFVYGLFRSSPLVLHQSLYNAGHYNHASQDFDSSEQVINNLYQAEGSGIFGKNYDFARTYNALKNYTNITDVRDSGKGTFTMISNDTAHNIIMLQEPEYEPARVVDNRSYEAEHSIRYSMTGDKLSFNSVNQMIHYQCNMAAMIQLGKWFDYLRENDLYDNTKIIIVSDHGTNLMLPDMKFGDSQSQRYYTYNDSAFYKSLLLVKDFDSKELTVDDTFMTNADTPTLAFSDIIDNPVNPFTGKQINSDAKNAPEHHIAYTNTYSVYQNNGKTFKDILWVGLKGNDSSDMSSWRVIGKSLN